MTKRFVRSVIRVFVVFNVEMSPAALGNKKRALQSATQPLMRCKRAFQELLLEKADLFYQFRFYDDH